MLEIGFININYQAYKLIDIYLCLITSDFVFAANVMEITQTYIVFFLKAVYINIYQPLYIIILAEFVQLVFC